MPTRKPAKKSAARKPRPNNPYGIENEEWWRITREAGEKYVGKCIAWSANHDRVLASADTYEELHRELERLGVDAHDVIFQFVEPYLYGVFDRQIGP